MQLLNRSEEIELAERIQQGDKEARDRLITANIGLCGKVAKRYFAESMTHDDLVEYGIIGLMTAVDRYNPKTHTCAFSTYAYGWIRNSIQRAREQLDPMIRIPSNKAKSPDKAGGYVSAHGGWDFTLCPGSDSSIGKNYTPLNADTLDRLTMGLSSRTQDILRRRYNGSTLEEIGQDYGLTKEGVRSIVMRSRKILSRRLEVLDDELVTTCS